MRQYKSKNTKDKYTIKKYKNRELQNRQQDHLVKCVCPELHRAISIWNIKVFRMLWVTCMHVHSTSISANVMTNNITDTSPYHNAMR